MERGNPFCLFQVRRRASEASYAFSAVLPLRPIALHVLEWCAAACGPTRGQQSLLRLLAIAHRGRIHAEWF